MKKITILALCVFSVGICAAQLNGGGNAVHTVNNDNPNAGPIAILTGKGIIPSDKNLGQLFGLNTIHNSYGNRRNGTRGYNSFLHNLDPSLDMRWKRTRLIMNDIPCDLSARYNPLSDEIEIKNDKGIYRLAKEDNLSVTFLDSNETYIAKSYVDQNGDKVTNYFLLVKDANGIELLKKKELVSYINLRNHANLRTNDVFYLIQDHKLIDLSLDRKSIKKNFPNHSKSLLAFIKTNKLKDNSLENSSKLAYLILSIEAIETQNIPLVLN